MLRLRSIQPLRRLNATFHRPIQHFSPSTVASELESTNGPKRRKPPPLVQSIQAFIKSKKEPSLIHDFVHSKLDKHPFTFRTTQTYNQVLRLLVKHNLLSQAASVYERMLKEGVVPSTATDTQMTAVALVLASDNDEEFTAALERVFSSTTFSDTMFTTIIRTFSHLQPSLSRRQELLEGFLSSHSKTIDSSSPQVLAALTDVHASTGAISEALDIAFTLLGRGEAMQLIPRSFSTILYHIRPTQENQERVKEILALMREAGVTPNAAVLDVLIAGAVWDLSMHKAFALFDTVLTLSASTSSSLTPKTDGIFPTGPMFRRLFRLLATGIQASQVAATTPHTLRTRKFNKLPNNVIMPRPLFKLLTSYTMTKERKPKPKLKPVALQNPKSDENIPPPPPSQIRIRMNTPLLNAALCAFLAMKDYAAAFVVTRSFKAYGIKPDVKTYRIVFGDFIHKMRRASGFPRRRNRLDEHAALWVRYLVGPDPEKVVVMMKKEEGEGERVRVGGGGGGGKVGDEDGGIMLERGLELEHESESEFESNSEPQSGHHQHNNNRHGRHRQLRDDNGIPSMSEDIVSQILMSVKRKEPIPLSPEKPLVMKKARRHAWDAKHDYDVPSISMILRVGNHAVEEGMDGVGGWKGIEGMDDVYGENGELASVMSAMTPKERVGFDSVPLERLLRRAIAAQIALEGGEGVEGGKMASLVSNRIALAKKAVLASTETHLEPEEQERRSEGTGKEQE